MTGETVRNEEILALIEQVIVRHIPHHGKLYDKDGELHDYDGSIGGDKYWANQIIINSLSPTGIFDSWNVEDEDAKLDDLLRTARKLLYQRSMVLTHAGDFHGLRIVIHHGELREVLHGGSDRASGRLYGG